MKTIQGRFSTIQYPVGDNITSNIPIINNIGNYIKSILIKKDIDINSTINLICSGSSGAIIASLVAVILSKKYNAVFIRHIKKEGEDSHGINYGETYFAGTTFNIIVDDFIAQGRTMKYIFSKIPNKVKIDLIAVSHIDNPEMIIPFFEEKKVKILLTDRSS
jgi:orotate phosphoribosyltransferase-like protein